MDESIEATICEHCGQELKKASKERKEIRADELDNIDRVGDALTDRQDKLDGDLTLRHGKVDDDLTLRQGKVDDDLTLRQGKVDDDLTLRQGKVDEALIERQDKVDEAAAAMLSILQRIELKLTDDAEIAKDVKQLEMSLRARIQKQYDDESK